MKSLPCSLVVASVLVCTTANAANDVNPFTFFGIDPRFENDFKANDWRLDKPKAPLADIESLEVTDLAFLPDGRSIIIARDGAIWVRRVDGTMRMDAANIAVSHKVADQGLLGVVAIRSFRDTPDGSREQRTILLYATVAVGAESRNVLLRAVVNTDDSISVEVTPVSDLGLAATVEGQSGGGLSVSGNYVFVGVGVGGNDPAADNQPTASCLNLPQGKILRLRLDGSVPDDNPLAKLPRATACAGPGVYDFSSENLPPDPRIYIWGVKNPFRLWVDHNTDLVWVADPGTRYEEEFSIASAGSHLGFPFFEGRTELPNFGSLTCNRMLPSRSCTDPAYAYDDVPTQRAIVGGLIPSRDNGIKPSSGQLCYWKKLVRDAYFFIDYIGKTVFMAEVQPGGGGISPKPIRFGIAPGVSGIRMGPNNSMYVIKYGAGAITVLSPTNTSGPCIPIELAPPQDAGADASLDAPSLLPDAKEEEAGNSGLPVDADSVQHCAKSSGCSVQTGTNHNVPLIVVVACLFQLCGVLRERRRPR